MSDLVLNNLEEERLKFELFEIYISALNWQKKLLLLDLPFSLNSNNKVKSIDSISLNIDLAYMLGEAKWCKNYVSWILQKQDNQTGLWFEDYHPDTNYQKDNPRLLEMVGTYLGFQVSGLLMKLNVPAKPISFWDFFLEDNLSLENYIMKMPWERSPWGSGGWVDSLGTMFKANFEWGNILYEDLFCKLIEILEKMQSQKTGFWGYSNIQGIAGQINGTYHLMRGTFFLNDEVITHKETLLNSVIDYVQSEQMFNNSNGEACYDLDAVFLLYKLSNLLPNQRKDEVNSFAKNRLLNLLNRKNSEGLYGYYIEYSQDKHNYYFVGPKKKGSSDIQGVVFYLTVIYYLSKILYPELEIPWKESLTHG